MTGLILNQKTEQALQAYFARPSHAVALVGPTGAGKGALAVHMAAQILQLDLGKLESYAYFRHYKPDKNVITIEMARNITAQMKLKTTGEQTIRRVVIIEDAHTMTTEAQNAVLKLLEEPPADTVIILTISSLNAVLATISSRLQSITVHPVSEELLADYFLDQGYKQSNIKRSYLMSGGLPGLMYAMLESDTGHPLVQSIEQAKVILQSDTFTRLTMIDDIAKQKQLDNLLFALKQTAQAALAANAAQAGREKALERWALVLRQAHEAQDMLSGNVQTKLVLTNLFMHI